MTLSLHSLKSTPRRPARRQFPRKQPRFRKRVTQTYNALGNITSKTGVGAYTYDSNKIHAVVSAGSNAYAYDANGNLTGGGGRAVTWTSWNMRKRPANPSSLRR